MNLHRTAIAAATTLALWSCGKQAEKPAAKFEDPCASLYEAGLKPFYHGVASGDPLADRVILWTRVTPEDSVSRIAVEWEISESPEFTSVYKSDTLSTTPARDYTVKVDVDALRPGSVYYYRFKALGGVSPTGRTKTSPVAGVDSLKLAIVSCANWEWGYFNAYEKIADRKDVDAVLHLGDYIYEYGTGGYGDTTMRKNLPANEIISLSDYRTRHSSYRTDKGLRLMSQQHPLIAIWDDHEVANDAYTAGAQNHQADKEGDYQRRKNVAKQAYYEWIPIRENTKLYRSFAYGPMADILMLDERLEGRTKPVDSVSDPAYNNDDRTMLGTDQLSWLETNLKESKAGWKIIGNQVMFADVYLNKVYPNRPRNLDSWDGYPSEKAKLTEFIVSNKLKDVVFLTGDTHASWAIEAATDVPNTYNKNTSAGAFAIELGTTSVSSANDDERTPTEEVKKMESVLLQDNPHIKYVNRRDHGYLLLTLYNDRAKAEWYFMETLRSPETKEFLGAKFNVEKGTVKLTK
jgi:alkaline phosphatase D